MNCLNLKYQHFSLLPGEDMKNFFLFCKENKLHKQINSESTSRLHSIFNYDEICNGAEAIVGYEDSLPVSIAFVEAREQSEEFAQNLVSGEKSPVYNLGFVHFYVHPLYRSLGIASDLANCIEKHCLKKVSKNNISENTVMFFVAQEAAFDLLQKNTNYTYVIHSDIKHRHRQVELNQLKENIDNQTNIKMNVNNFFVAKERIKPKF